MTFAQMILHCNLFQLFCALVVSEILAETKLFLRACGLLDCFGVWQKREKKSDFFCRVSESAKIKQSSFFCGSLIRSSSKEFLRSYSFYPFHVLITKII
jgi:hypothetical protein